MADSDGVIKIGTEVDISGIQSGMQQAQAAVTASTTEMSSAYERLAQTTAEYSIQQKVLTSTIQALVTGTLPYSVAVKALTPALIEQSAATKALQASKAALAEIEKRQTQAIAEQNAALMANTLAMTQSSVAANTMTESTTLARASAGLAGREVGGFLGAQLGKVAATSETLAPLLAAAFPIAGAFALGTIVYQLGESFKKVQQQANEAAERIEAGWRSITDEIRASNDSLLMEGDRLQSELDKLLKRPGENGISIAFDEAAASADKLSVSIDRDLQKMQQMVDLAAQEKAVGFWGSMTTGKAETGDTQKLISDAIKPIQDVNKEHSDVVARAAASGDKDNLAQAQTAQLVDLQEAYKRAETTINASLTSIEAKQAYFKESGIGKDQADNINALRGALESLAAQQKNIGESFHNQNLQQQVTPARDASDQQRLAQENARKAAEAQRRAQEAAIQAARQGLDERKSVEDLTALQEAAYWEAISSTAASGSKLYLTAVDAANKALGQSQKQLQELSTRMGSEMEETWAAATRAADEAARHQNELANTIAASADRITAAQQKASESVQEASLKASEASGGISRLSAAQDEARIHAQAYAAELERLNQELTRTSEAYAKSVQSGNYTPQDSNQEAQKVAQLQAQIAQLKGQMQSTGINDQTAIQQQIAQPYLTAFNQINQGWLQVQNQMLFSTRNLSLAFAKMGQQIFISIVDNIEKAALMAIEKEMVMTLAHQQGVTTRVATDATGAEASTAISQSSSMAQGLDAAKLAFKNTYAAVSGWPVVGPILAPVLASAAFVAVAAFEDGTGYVPRDGMAYLHEGEAIVPAPTMDQLRGSDGSGGGVTVNQHNNWNGMHDRDFKRALARNASDVAGAVHRHLRQGGRA